MGSERPQGRLLDPVIVGRRLRGARIMAGFDRVSDACVAVQELGAACSERTLYAIERGEQLPDLEQMTALGMVYLLSDVPSWIAPAYREDVLEYARSVGSSVGLAARK